MNNTLEQVLSSLDHSQDKLPFLQVLKYILETFSEIQDSILKGEILEDLDPKTDLSEEGELLDISFPTSKIDPPITQHLWCLLLDVDDFERLYDAVIAKIAELETLLGDEEKVLQLSKKAEELIELL